MRFRVRFCLDGHEIGKNVLTFVLMFRNEEYIPVSFFDVEYIYGFVMLGGL